MMEIEKTNTEKMLREFWLIHRHFTERPELLKDSNVGKVYDSLMGIRDVDGLKDWLRLKERIDTQSNEAVRYEDVLGRMYNLAIHAEQAELRWAADGMARLANNGFHMVEENVDLRFGHQIVDDFPVAAGLGLEFGLASRIWEGATVEHEAAAVAAEVVGIAFLEGKTVDGDGEFGVRS